MIDSIQKNGDHTHSRSHSPELFDLFGAGVAVGGVCGAFFLCVDVFVHQKAISASETSQLILWFAGMGVGLGVPVLVVLAILAQRINACPRIQVLVAVACGLGAQLILIETMTGKQLLATIPIPWLLAWAVYRFDDSRGTCLLRRSTACVLALSWFVPLIVSSGITRQGEIVRLFLIGVVLAVAYIVQRFSQARYYSLLGIQSLFLIAIQLLGTSSPGWAYHSIAEAGESVKQYEGAEMPPNIVIVVLDTTRRDHFGCYGDDRGLSPDFPDQLTGMV